MLVPPDDEFYGIVKHAFGHGLLGSVLDSSALALHMGLTVVLQWVARTTSNLHAHDSPILMHQEHIEPIILPHFPSIWHKHLHPITPQLIMHSRIAYIAHTIHGEMGIALFEKDGFDADTLVGLLVVLVGC